MRKQRKQPGPKSLDDLGQQMMLREVAFAPGAIEGQPLLMMRCVVEPHANRPLKTITVGVLDVDVDAFLVAVQQGVAAYKEHQAGERH